MNTVSVYQLRKNEHQIIGIQKATLTREDYGFQITHGLFGSQEWWQQIETGKLPLHTLRGTITRVYMGGMNDWPMFELLTAEGKKETFTRERDRRELDEEYQAGRNVEIDYVWQKPKQRWQSQFPETRVIVEIRIVDIESGATPRDAPWPFDQAPNCATVTTRQVMERSEPILFVTHDADDHGWQFLGASDLSEADALLVSLEEIVHLDSTMLDVADLPPGWQAVRSAVGEAWTCGEAPPVPEDDR